MENLQSSSTTLIKLKIIGSNEAYIFLPDKDHYQRPSFAKEEIGFNIFNNANWEIIAAYKTNICSSDLAKSIDENKLCWYKATISDLPKRCKKVCFLVRLRKFGLLKIFQALINLSHRNIDFLMYANYLDNISDHKRLT